MFLAMHVEQEQRLGLVKRQPRKKVPLAIRPVMQPVKPEPSPCPFCGKPHPVKQICMERVKSLQEARNNGTRPHRKGYWRQDIR